MAEEIAFLKLPFAVDLRGIREDLARCLALEWQPHFNTRDYEGGWNSISLRSPNGATDNILAVANEASEFQDTPLMATCPHFTALMQALQCEKESVRLLRQAAGGEIKTHRDMGLHYADGVFRLHFPIFTNDEVDFVVAGHRLPMQAGECWFADFSLPHSVVNRGDTERIHLVVDCLRNPWSDAWFEQAGFDMESLAPKPIPEAQLRAMIAELRVQGSPTSLALAADFERQLNPKEPNALELILQWLAKVGIRYTFGEVPESSFLPGVAIEKGTLRIDRDRLLFVGDLLHEAGHIALMPAEKRPLLSGDIKFQFPEHEGDEVGVILWSYAAALDAGVPPEVVFHSGGYHDSGDWLKENFLSGTYIGLPLLVWLGLTEDPKVAELAGRKGFPQMLRWMRA
jgi:hypothetical protein